MDARKTALLAMLALAVAFAVCGCAGEQPTGSATVSSASASASSSAKEPEPELQVLDLTGTWDQVNRPLIYPFRAVIEGDTITIWWHDEPNDTDSLYWAGTYVAPTEPSDTWAWTSENDHSRTDVSVMAAQAETKDFRYEDGQLLFYATAMGTEQTAHLERAE